MRCVADPEHEPTCDWWRGSSSELPDGNSAGCSAGRDCRLSAGLSTAGQVPERRQPGGKRFASCLRFVSSRSSLRFLLFFSHLFSSSEVSS